MCLSLSLSFARALSLSLPIPLLRSLSLSRSPSLPLSVALSFATHLPSPAPSMASIAHAVAVMLNVSCSSCHLFACYNCKYNRLRPDCFQACVLVFAVRVHCLGDAIRHLLFVGLWLLCVQPTRKSGRTTGERSSASSGATAVGRPVLRPCTG